MLKKIFAPAALALACALLLTACGSSDNTATTNNTSTTNKTTTTSSPTTTTSTPTTTSSPTTTAAGEKVGVPECDDYLAKYEACLTGKVPEAARAQFNSALEQTRKSWRQLAENPQTKASLASACKMATDQAKTAMKAYNCEF
ncbi:MAG TPA: hypothetical protein VF779_20285 [Pyrinomonadaceae bacterium]